MVIQIDIPDLPTPNYSPLFDFIDSPQGQEYLLRAERGNHSFKSALLTLKARGALPMNSSKRVWHVIRMMYTKRQPFSVISYYE